MVSAKLQLIKVSKSFGGKSDETVVLSDLSLTVGENEFVSIIGPSGSGKTTLFNIIGGLLLPDSGQIILDGKEITGLKGLISYMPQNHSLFPWRTVEENVILAQEIAGIPRKEALQEAREWLVKVGLGGYEQEYPHVLSGGMQQRVSFLRALLSPQELMCLDEPFGSLDALTRVEMQHWLLNLWEQNKRSVLFITHSIEEALFLSDRIYVLSNKPTTILQEIKVPYSRPRDPAIQLQSSFVQLRQEIYELLKLVNIKNS